MAIGPAASLVRLAIGNVLTAPSPDNLRIARGRLRSASLDSSRGSLSAQRAFAKYGGCWVKASTAAEARVATQIERLVLSIRQRIAYRTGAARRSVRVIRGELQDENVLVSYRMDFDVGHTDVYTAIVGVPYAPYLKDIEQWLPEVCSEWHEEVHSDALQTFLFFYVRCAGRRN